MQETLSCRACTDIAKERVACCTMWVHVSHTGTGQRRTVSSCLRVGGMRLVRAAPERRTFSHCLKGKGCMRLIRAGGQLAGCLRGWRWWLALCLQHGVQQHRVLVHVQPWQGVHSAAGRCAADSPHRVRHASSCQSWPASCQMAEAALSNACSCRQCMLAQRTCCRQPALCKSWLAGCQMAEAALRRCSCRQCVLAQPFQGNAAAGGRCSYSYMALRLALTNLKTRSHLASPPVVSRGDLVPTDASTVAPTLMPGSPVLALAPTPAFTCDYHLDN